MVFCNSAASCVCARTGVCVCSCWDFVAVAYFNAVPNYAGTHGSVCDCNVPVALLLGGGVWGRLLATVENCSLPGALGLCSPRKLEGRCLQWQKPIFFLVPAPITVLQPLGAPPFCLLQAAWLGSLRAGSALEHFLFLLLRSKIWEHRPRPALSVCVRPVLRCPPLTCLCGRLWQVEEGSALKFIPEGRR